MSRMSRSRVPPWRSSPSASPARYAPTMATHTSVASFVSTWTGQAVKRQLIVEVSDWERKKDRWPRTHLSPASFVSI